MDERVQHLKNLKKAYLKQRRKATWGWDLLQVLLLVLLAVASVCVLYMMFYNAPLVRQLDALIWTPLKNLVGLTMSLRAVGIFAIMYGHYFALGFLVLWIIVLLLRGRAVAKTRKYDSYLDYNTMKITLKTEKKEAKL